MQEDGLAAVAGAGRRARADRGRWCVDEVAIRPAVADLDSTEPHPWARVLCPD